MKYGMRSPSLSKSISSRIKGRVTKSIKRSTIPGYGMKGTGWVKDPSRALYNSVYRKTTYGISDIGKTSYSRPYGSIESSFGRTWNKTEYGEDFYCRNYLISYDLPFELSDSGIDAIRSIETTKTSEQNQAQIDSCSKNVELLSETVERLSDADLRRLPKRKPEKVSIIWIETTGMSKAGEEILSVTILNGQGVALFNQLIRPQTRKRWPKASLRHGITWNDVKDRKQPSSFQNRIQALVADKDILIFLNPYYQSLFYNTFEIEPQQTTCIYATEEFKRIQLLDDEDTSPLFTMALSLNVEQAHGTPQTNSQLFFKVLSALPNDPKYQKARRKCLKHEKDMLETAKERLAQLQSFQEPNADDVRQLFSTEYDAAEKKLNGQINSLECGIASALIVGLASAVITYCLYSTFHFILGTLSLIVFSLALFLALYDVCEKGEIAKQLAKYKERRSDSLASISIKKL